MTTITYRNGVMSADSAVGTSSNMNGATKKIFDTGHYVIGASGSFAALLIYIEWAKKDFASKDKPELPSTSEALILHRDGALYYIDNNAPPVELDSEYEVIGSGSSIALGAFHAGATSKQAVFAAIKHDSCTGGRVLSVTFEGNEE